MADIVEFWIVNHSGIPLFCYSPDEELDSTLVGGFFSAIQAFAKQISGDHLDEDEYIEQLSLGKFSFTFLSNDTHQLFLIAKSKKKIKAKKISSHLKKIDEMFINQFHDQISNFRGDSEVFNSFLIEFKMYFEDNFARLKGMW